MVDTKISGEIGAGALDGTELVEIVQSGNNRKATTGQIRAYVNGPRGIFTSSTPGSFNWTVPAGVFVLTEVWCIGGGGSGGWGPPSGCASGGSAGSTGIKYGVAVTPGQVINGVIGAGGSGSGSGSGNGGGDTAVVIGSTTYSAWAGPGGLATSSSSCNSPGVAATPTGFDDSYIGGQGNIGIFINGTVVSGQGGNCQLGGIGGVGGGGVPGSGSTPGGGGGGTGSGAGTSGAGGNGMVKFVY